MHHCEIKTAFVVYLVAERHHLNSSMVEAVLSSIDEWKTTLWADINVENMEMECKRFVKEIRMLDKEMRAWDAFAGLDSTVKNMVTSLRAVGELQNPAIRERHWQQLMQATKVRPPAPGAPVLTFPWKW